jgi:hypothetical protein
MPEDQNLLAWGDELKRVVEQDALDPLRAFSQPPRTNAEPNDRLTAILEVWTSLVREGGSSPFGDDNHDPVSAAAEKFRRDIIARAQSMARRFEDAMRGLEAEANRLIHDANAFPALRFIITNEFAPGCLGTLDHNGRPLAIAGLNGVEAKHPYRTLFAETELPQWNDVPHIVLGAARPSAISSRSKPGQWYSVSTARYWSGIIVNEQREAERKEKEEKQRIERAQERAAMQNPQTRIDHLSRRIMDLERELKAPKEQAAEQEGPWAEAGQTRE